GLAAASPAGRAACACARARSGPACAGVRRRCAGRDSAALPGRRTADRRRPARAAVPALRRSADRGDGGRCDGRSAAGPGHGAGRYRAAGAGKLRRTHRTCAVSHRERSGRDDFDAVRQPGPGPVVAVDRSRPAGAAYRRVAGAAARAGAALCRWRSAHRTVRPGRLVRLLRARPRELRAPARRLRTISLAPAADGRGVGGPRAAGTVRACGTGPGSAPGIGRV
ncbi:hypothetical protein XPR_4213, partial [Xanthomonas arboricola pv. pruni MAFF 301420]